MECVAALKRKHLIEAQEEVLKREKENIWAWNRVGINKSKASGFWNQSITVAQNFQMAWTLILRETILKVQGNCIPMPTSLFQIKQMKMLMFFLCLIQLLNQKFLGPKHKRMWCYWRLMLQFKQRKLLMEICTVKPKLWLRTIRMTL